MEINVVPTGLDIHRLYYYYTQRRAGFKFPSLKKTLKICLVFENGRSLDSVFPKIGDYGTLLCHDELNMFHLLIHLIAVLFK